jgi:membrane protease YdiL (CAAX protease family)
MADQAGQPLPVDPAVVVLAQIAAALTLAVPLNALFAFGEEFGWRGYLLPRLMQRLGPWPGVLAHGAIWGFWHAPLILLLGYNYPGHPVAGVGLFTVTGVLGGVLMAWLQLASRSVVPPTIAHAAFNACAGLPFLLLRGVDPAIGGVAYSPIGWLALAGAIALVARHPAFRQAR